MLAGALRGRGIDVVATREPTAGEHGQRIRAMAQSGERVDPKQELEWFVLDRREHVASVIEPGLAAGRVVLTDRYYLSSVAYQGARGLDAKSILADSEAEFPLPDLVVVIEMDPEKGLARVGARGGVAEPAFEEIDFQRRVAEQFAALGCPYLMRVPGDGAPEAVHRRVAEIVLARLGLENSA
jgi:dTMP kinase